MPNDEKTPYPGQALGLPESGRGSLATWGSRIVALMIDWGSSMLVAMLIFGTQVMHAHDWHAWMPMAVFFVQKSALTILTGSSFGQLLSNVGITQVSGRPIGWWRAIVRTALICLVFPAVIIGVDRRGIDDIALGTVAVKRK